MRNRKNILVFILSFHYTIEVVEGENSFESCHFLLYIQPFIDLKSLAKNSKFIGLINSDISLIQRSPVSRVTIIFENLMHHDI